MATKELGEGDFEYAFMHRGELHVMRGKMKDATLHYIPDVPRPYVCLKCEVDEDLDKLMDMGLDCHRPMRVFIELEQDERGRFSCVRKVENE